MEENNQEGLTRREKKKLKRQEKQIEKAKSQDQTSMIKKLGFVALVVIGAFFIWNQLQAKPSSDNPASETANTSNFKQVLETDHVRGNINAPVVITEYSDLQCPACRGYEPLLVQILAQNPEDVALVYRHFPLRQIHKNAQISAQAAEAAGMQGKFWEMHDKLFETQEDWSNVRDPRGDFVKYAGELGLDTEKFEADMNSDAAKKIVDDAYNHAISIGTNSTPTIYINGEKQDPPRSVDAFQAIIDEILANTPQTEATESGEISE